MSCLITFAWFISWAVLVAFTSICLTSSFTLLAFIRTPELKTSSFRVRAGMWAGVMAFILVGTLLAIPASLSAWQFLGSHLVTFQ
jgi:hypothetical protein